MIDAKPIKHKINILVQSGSFMIALAQVKTQNSELKASPTLMVS